MLTLFFEVIRNIAVIAVVIYIITQCKPFRRSMNQSHYSRWDKYALVVVFGMLSAVGNYLNVPFQQTAMVHARLIGTIIGGLFGGPLVGIGAAVIGMIPRFFIPVSSFPVITAALVANVLIGALSGYVNQRYGARNISLWLGGGIALVSEAVLKSAVLWQAGPQQVFELEKYIALPAAISTCLGVILSIYIIRGVYADEDNNKANAAKKVIDIIFNTRGIFRKNGFTREAAQQIGKIIYNTLTVDYVAVSSPEGIWVEYTQGANKKDCKNTLQLPLRVSHRDIAVIYISRPGLRKFHPYEEKWLLSLAELLSLELYQMALDRQTVLLSQAELNVLKSQIRPHFIFNMLSNIKAVINTEPEKAKELICDLSSFLRGRLHRMEDTVSLAAELEAVDTYIRLEKMRYGERLRVVKTVEPETLTQQVPYFILQILVENAIKHGIFKKKNGGTVSISAKRREDCLYLTVHDDGEGISPAVLARIRAFSQQQEMSDLTESTGIGLRNIYDRIQTLYGKRGIFSVQSTMERGTMIFISIPWGQERGL